MIIVGNIISEDILTGVPNNFFCTKEMVTNDIPTIIIGWELTKKLFPDSSILNKKIKDNIYWTFSTTEKRTIFEEDLKSFIKKSYNDYVKDIKHFNLDPIVYNLKTTEEFITKIKAFEESFIYLYDNKVVYLYYNFIIFSIDLEQLDFIGFDRETVLNEIKKSSKHFEKNSEKNYKNELKYLDIKYIPYLICKDATKNTTSSLIHQ